MTDAQFSDFINGLEELTSKIMDRLENACGVLTPLERDKALDIIIEEIKGVLS